MSGQTSTGIRRHLAVDAARGENGDVLWKPVLPFPTGAKARQRERLAGDQANPTAFAATGAVVQVE